ncbi:F-box domain-containing protein [Pleurotus pulmonarius]
MQPLPRTKLGLLPHNQPLQQGGCHTMVSRLPLELIHEIIRYVHDRRTLASLLLVSRTVHPQAELSFYAKASFLNHEGESLMRRLKNFCEQISASNGRLALCLTYFVVKAAPGEWTFPSEVFMTINSILLQCHKLTEVILDFGNRMGTDWDLFNCARDMRFTLKHLSYATGTYYVRPLIALLESQPSLERLEFPMVHELVLSAKAIPRLSALHASQRVASQLLPGRPVTHLRITKLFVIEEEFTLESLHKIRVFSSFGKLETILGLASHMPALLCLDVGSSDSSPLDSTPFIPLFKDTQLRYIRFSGTCFAHDTGSSSHVAMLCFRQIPSLRCIECEAPQGNYSRWHRGAIWWPITFRPTSFDWRCIVEENRDAAHDSRNVSTERSN